MAGLPIAIFTTVIFLPSMLIIFRINQYISWLVGLLMLSRGCFCRDFRMDIAWRDAHPHGGTGGLVLGTAVIVALTDLGDDQSASGG